MTKRCLLARLFAGLAILGAGCGHQESALADPAPATIALKDLDFTCSREEDHVPPPSEAAEALFLAARAQHRQALAGDTADKALLQSALQGYRRAAEAGHWKGVRNLALIGASGIDHRGEVVVAPDHGVAKRYAKQLMKMNVATGYNLMAAYAYDGWGGIQQNEATALAYMRKAADLGLPSAQRQTGIRLRDLSYAKDLAPESAPLLRELGRRMIACAVRQGDREAAFKLAVDYEIRDHNYPYALFYYFQAGKMGEGASLMNLREWFAEGQYGYAKNPGYAKVFKHFEDQSDLIGTGPFPELDRYITLPPPPNGGSYPPKEMGWPNEWTR